ncbi:ABC transporter permease [Kitasatospora paranensis]|uniref:ABC transporter permease n=1 Tax=Kitasatospora paranensis TaxID=258053 RepID=A0ABW2FVY4_9ACTN
MKTTVAPSRFSVHDLVSEALSGVLQRPGRSVLTMLGTVLGIGAFVAVLGLTATASSQIDGRFNLLAATEVTVQDIGPGDEGAPMAFPADASARARAINGTVGAGIWWPLPIHPKAVASSPFAPEGTGQGLGLYAAEPEALVAMHPTLADGVLFGRFHQDRKERVAVLGRGAAERLGISRLDAQPAVFIDGSPYTVVGILDDISRFPELLNAVVIPSSTAMAAYGSPQDPRASMVVDTRMGAAQVVAGQLALALRPDAPQFLKVSAPPDPTTLKSGVANDLGTLFLLLAGISLLIGAVGIANTTLVAVLERSGEIGLRRALGARPRHVAFQFLTESAALGTLGGLVGTCLGVAVVLAVAVAQDWTAALSMWAVLPAPLIGSVTGILAGSYPSLRAARIEPVEALRR